MFIHKVTENISFKLPTKKDAPAILDLVDSSRISLSQFLPWPKSMLSLSDETIFLNMGIQRMAKGEFWFAIILYRGEPAGIIDLHNISQNHHRCQVGYWLGNRFEGKGIMTASLRELEQIAFNELDMNRIELMADERNEKSRNVAKRRGFTLEGTLKRYALYNGAYRDVVLYAKIKPS